MRCRLADPTAGGQGVQSESFCLARVRGIPCADEALRSGDLGEGINSRDSSFPFYGDIITATYRPAGHSASMASPSAASPSTTVQMADCDRTRVTSTRPT